MKNKNLRDNKKSLKGNQPITYKYWLNYFKQPGKTLDNELNISYLENTNEN